MHIDCPEPNNLQHRSGYMDVLDENVLLSLKKKQLKETKLIFF